jgi:hypothetical protein
VSVPSKIAISYHIVTVLTMSDLLNMNNNTSDLRVMHQLTISINIILFEAREIPIDHGSFHMVGGGGLEPPTMKNISQKRV